MPWQIADTLNLNRATTRGHLRKLLSEGKIVQPYPQTYASEIIYGMSVQAPLRIHNLTLSVAAPWLDFSDEMYEWTGKVKIRIQYGITRHKITGYIGGDSKSDVSMDYNTVQFALNRFYDLIELRTQHKVENVVVTRFEANRDVAGVTIEGGIKCYTRKEWDGVLVRIYQKDEKVRAEFVSNKKIPVDHLEQLIMGGVTGYQSHQAVYQLMQEIKKRDETQKYFNRMVSDKLEKMYKLIEASLRNK